MTLHMPHPDMIIEGRLIFRFRERLKRRFDWDEDTFEDQKQLKRKGWLEISTELRPTIDWFG
jgi:hypothetical protein